MEIKNSYLELFLIFSVFNERRSSSLWCLTDLVDLYADSDN